MEVMRLDAVVAYALANGVDPDKASEEFYARLNEPMDLAPQDDLRRLLGV